MAEIRSRRWTAALAAGAVLTLTGCGSDVLDDSNGKPSGTAAADAAAKLTTLPSLEDTERQVRDAVEQLAAFIGTLVPGAQWAWMGDRMASECDRPYNGTAGTKVFLQDYVGKFTIPDDVWPQVLAKTKELAATLGATEHEDFHDEPGKHDVRFYSREGTAIHLGAAGNTVIDAATGCRLPHAEPANP